MATTDWSGAPLPDSTSADNVPADLAAYSDVIDPLLVLQATDTADRDSRFALLPKGSTVMTGTPLALWVKAVSGSPTWDDVMYDSGWVTAGFTAQAGWAVNLRQIRRRAGIVELRGSMNRTGADLTPTSGGIHDGNLADTAVLQLPSGWFPSSTVALATFCSFGLAIAALDSGGMVSVLAVAGGNMKISTGDNLIFNGTWLDG